MKKTSLAVVALCGAMTFALTSCGGGNNNAEPPVSDSPAQQEDETACPESAENAPEVAPETADTAPSEQEQ